MTSVLSSLGNALPLARSGSYWFPPQASDVAAGHDFLYDFTLWLCIVFFVAICGATVYFMIKYRKRPGHEAVRTATHNTKLELAWSIGPLFLLMAIFGISTYWYLHMISPPKDEYVHQIDVNAQRWNWTFKIKGEGLDGTYECSKLHLIKDRPYQIAMTTPDNDVIHSLFIPAFRMKQDCVPGRYNKLWFRPTMTHAEAGLEDGFDLFCTEYCGTGHSDMITKVMVYDTEAEWKAGVVADGDLTTKPALDRGRMIYERLCKSCHTIDGSALIGPSFKGLWGKSKEMESGATHKVDSSVEGRTYLRESVLTPGKEIVKGYPNQMTPFTWGDKTDSYLEGIEAYLESLKD
jgi:cytochrome c oxidase subunit 2